MKKNRYIQRPFNMFLHLKLQFSVVTEIIQELDLNYTRNNHYNSLTLPLADIFIVMGAYRSVAGYFSFT